MADGDEVAERAFPLTDTDLADLERQLERLKGADDLIAKSQQAGIDVEPFRQRVLEQKARILKIKQAFFPGR